MRAVLKGKTQEFIQGGITPSGLATQVRRAIIKGFDATTYRATVQLLGSLSVWLEGVPVAKHLGSNLLSNGVRCGVLFFDESNPNDACVAFVYDGVPGPWITSGLVVDGAITAADCLSNVAGGVATVDPSGDLNPPNHVRAAGRLYPGGQGTRYLYDAGVTSGLAIGGGNLSATGRIHPGTGSALQTTGYIVADSTGRLAFMGGHVGLGTTEPGERLHVVTAADVTGIKLEGAAGVRPMIHIKHAGQTADGQAIGFIRFDNGAYPAVVSISGARDGADNSGRIDFDTQNAGAYANRMTIRADGKIGMGTESPDNTLHVHKASAGTVTAHSQAALVVEYNDDVYQNFLTPNNKEAGILFGDPDSVTIGQIVYSHVTNAMRFSTAGAQRMLIDDNGKVGVGTPTPEQVLHIVTKTDVTGIKLEGATGVRPTIHVKHAGQTANDLIGLIRFANGAVTNVADIAVVRDGADNTAYIAFATKNAGAYGDRMLIKGGGDVSICGYFYPGTGSAFQSTRYIRDDGDRLLAYGGWKIDVGSGDTPLVFQRAGAYKWTNYVYATYDDLRWAAYIGGSWYDRMVLDDGSGNLYIDGTYNTFSPQPPKADMSPEEYLAWAMEDASKPLKPYPGIPKEPAELEKYRKDVSKIAIGVAKYVDHLKTQVAALDARLSQAGW